MTWPFVDLRRMMLLFIGTAKRRVLRASENIEQKSTLRGWLPLYPWSSMMKAIQVRPRSTCETESVPNDCLTEVLGSLVYSRMKRSETMRVRSARMFQEYWAQRVFSPQWRHVSTARTWPLGNSPRIRKLPYVLCWLRYKHTQPFPSNEGTCERERRSQAAVTCTAIKECLVFHEYDQDNLGAQSDHHDQGRELHFELGDGLPIKRQEVLRMNSTSLRMVTRDLTSGNARSGCDTNSSM